MKKALEEVVNDASLREKLMFALHETADFMRSQPGDSQLNTDSREG